jgi:hypothetical protein
MNYEIALLLAIASIAFLFFSLILPVRLVWSSLRAALLTIAIVRKLLRALVGLTRHMSKKTNRGVLVVLLSSDLFAWHLDPLSCVASHARSSIDARLSIVEIPHQESTLRPQIKSGHTVKDVDSRLFGWTAKRI